RFLRSHITWKAGTVPPYPQRFRQQTRILLPAPLWPSVCSAHIIAFMAHFHLAGRGENYFPTASRAVEMRRDKEVDNHPIKARTYCTVCRVQPECTVPIVL